MFLSRRDSLFQTKTADFAAPCPDQRERAQSTAGSAEPERMA